MRAGDITVALSELGRLEKTLAELDVLPRRVAVAAAPKISRLLQRQFAQGVDPYGRRWARLATGKRSRLTETGRLSSGTRAAPMVGGRAGLRIIVGLMGTRGRSPIVHQTGTRNMPARKILPERGLPREWRDAIETASKAEFRKITRRAT